MKLKKCIVYMILLSFASCTNSQVDKFRKDNRNSGKYESIPVKESPKEIWKFKTSGEIHSSAITDGKFIFVGSGDGCFYALNSRSGELIWKYETGSEIYSTAILEGKFVYFTNYDGDLYKLNKNNGSLIWKAQTIKDQKHIVKDYFQKNVFVDDFWDFYQSSPVIYDNNIYVGSGQNMYCFNKKTGNKNWKFKTEGIVHSSPAIENNKLFFGSFDSKVYCVDAVKGNEIWSYQTGRDTTYYVWLGVQASPTIENGKLYIGSRDALIYCFDANTGDTLWTNNDFERSWMPSSFAVSEKLYCGSSDGFSFYCINKDNGKIDYRIKTNSYTFSSPAIDQEMAYIGSANGRLYGINLKDQKIVWEYKTQGVVDDTLGVFNENGELNLDVYKELAKKMDVRNFENYVRFYELMFKNYGAILSSPIIDNGIIYFGSVDGSIYAVSDMK